MPIKISELPAAGALGGTEIVPLVQAGVTKRTTLSAIASFVQAAITLVTRATNLAGGANGSVPYQSAADTTAMLAAGSAGALLQTNGAAAPSWVTALADGFTATTQSANDNSTKVASTAYVDRAATSKIQPITASIGSSALTLTLNPTQLDFRSSDVASGAVTTAAVTSPVSVTVSNGSTLGSVSGGVTRVVVLAIYTGSAVELAVGNIAGGTNINEAGVISTTAEGGAGGADSSTVFYSTTARTNVPYRVVGVVEAINTAGAWGSLSFIQGYGGNALSAMSSIGYGQIWRSVTGSRTAGVNYYNTTGKPMLVAIRGGFASGALTIGGGIEAGRTNSTAEGNIYGIVPPGQVYAMSNGFTAWAELS